MFLYTLIVAGCEVGHVLFVKLCCCRVFPYAAILWYYVLYV